MSKPTTRRNFWPALSLMLLFAAALSTWSTAAPARPDVPQDLGGERRLRAHLATDRPTYRPGETVHGRAVLLDPFTRKPPQQHISTQWQVKSPKGDTVFSGWDGARGGIAAFTWTIPQDASGGPHTLLATFPGGEAPKAEVEFAVKAYRVPRLKTDLQFLRKAYGPGDEVVATLEVTRAEGGTPEGAQATVVARVDGAEVHRSRSSLDSEGKLTARFELPPAIERGEGSLAIVIEDGGVRETAAKTIPIVVAHVDLRFYPEGGELVAGLEGRVYFEARTPKDRPADVAGRVLDSHGREVASFRSEHEGRGRFSMTPRKGETYQAVLDEPSGLTRPFPLPEVRRTGLSLRALDDVVPAGGPVRIALSSSARSKIRVVVSRMEREVARRTLRLDEGRPRTVELEPVAPGDGVLRVTAFDEDGRPWAERIVFRRPSRSLRVSLEPDPARSTPRAKARVQVLVTDPSGEPVQATVGLRVVDDALLETIDRRDRAPRLPAQVFLEDEVRELADAHVYLTAGDEGALKLDLLLGTQGWRRFAFADPSTFVAKHGDDARRLLALRTPGTQRQRNLIMFKGGLDAGVDFEQEGLVQAMDAPPGAVRALQQEPLAFPEAVPAPPPVMDPFGAADIAASPPVPALRADFAEDKELAFEEDMGEWAGRVIARKVRPIPRFARVYAHRASPAPSGRRTDFAETLYWNAGLTTDAEGKASVEFDLSDSITTFRVLADAFDDKGALGEAEASIESRKPFYVEAKLPLEVTAGDSPRVPIALVNSTDLTLRSVVATTLGTGLALASGAPSQRTIALKPGGRAGIYVPLSVGRHDGPVTVRVRGTAEEHSDDVTRKVRVVPAGFPQEWAAGGRLEGSAQYELTIPAGVDMASVHSEIAVHPSPLASLTEALAALLREPSGCFEQTSSSNYPNVMILQYLQDRSRPPAGVIKRANDLLQRGYKRLVGYECSRKGYEWFGGDPGHEALTAYGLMEFVDMAQVMPVDQAMLGRTRKWLLDRRDGEGGFQRNAKALDTFGRAPQDITHAYIVWALTEADESDALKQEIAAVRGHIDSSNDPYYLALAANLLANVGDPAAATAMARLAPFQQDDGHIDGARTSITGSGGSSLRIETTSLAVLAWLRNDRYTAHVQKAMKWLFQRCKGGRFGATQATILALKAILAFEKASRAEQRAGTVLLVLDGKVVDEVPFEAARQKAILLPDIGRLLAPGKHSLELRMVEGAPMPFSALVRYHSLQPDSSPDCKVALRAALGRESVPEGETVDLQVALRNRTGEGLPMTLAIVGLPGGLEVRTEQLDELVDEGRIGAYELRGRDVVLYWRGLAPKATQRVNIDLLAAIPGSYTGPASRAYLYYTDEHKNWIPPLHVTITPR